MTTQQLSEALRDVPPIVCFANDWRGDPTSKHHVMRTYSRYVDVTWVESAGMRWPRFNLQDASRIALRLRRAAQSGNQTFQRLRVVSPLSVPLPGNALAETLNRQLWRYALSKEQKPHQRPIHWVYVPTVVPVIRHLPRRLLVYHCVDRWWAFSEYNDRAMREYHEWLCRYADVVFASSTELVDDCRKYRDDVALIRHGVDWDHFAQAAFTELPRPADIKDIRGPILGFFGLIHEWIDQHAVCAIADAFPAATVVLIGKVQTDVTQLLKRPNIRLLGQKPYTSLPAYAAYFDVALVPFVTNDLTLAVNPIKLREYLSAGVRVVATALPEIEVFGSHFAVRTAANAGQHVDAVRSLLSENWGKAERTRTAQSVLHESWLGRCTEMAEAVKATVDRLSGWQRS